MQPDKIAQAFTIRGNVVSYKKFGSGHINTTFKLTTDTDDTYILQNINKYVFRDPAKVTENICAVTEHIRRRSNDPGAALQFIPTRQGGFLHIDEENEYWRMYKFVEGLSLDLPERDEDFYQSAVAFGRFQELLSDFPAYILYESIPNFHNTPDRFRQLKEAVAQDKVGRQESAREEISAALELEEAAGVLQKMLDAGVLPLRVTHNDTKLNNVLLSPDTRTCICVLDLDTVMPGLSAYDFGDSIRFGAATAAEDEKDTSKMGLDLHLFEVYARGFIQAAPSLTANEIAALPLGAFTMTLEVAIRFLTDYLNGDVYFRTAYPEHNLIRARAQLALAKDMVSKHKEMERIIAQIVAEK